MSGLLRPGKAPHYCDRPNLDLRIRDGAVWRCGCGRRWILRTTQTGSASWQGQWERYHWWTRE